MTEYSRKLSAEIIHMTHLKEDNVYVVTFELAFGIQDPHEVSVAVDDTGQSSTQAYYESREIIASELMHLASLILEKN